MDDGRQSFDIVVASGPDCGRTVAMTGHRQTLGRSPTCGIRIEDPGLQPHHLVISGQPPDLVIEPLGGGVEFVQGGFRVGSTVCWVRPNTRLRSFEPDTARPFHRPPREKPIEVMDPPTAPVVRPEPHRAAGPPWGPVLGGAATGLIVTAVTGQWLVAVFSIVTASVAGITWCLHRLGHRRAHRRWTTAVARDRQEFDRRCRHFAEHLAEVRRDRHRCLGELLMAARQGQETLWAKRDITDVCVGFGSRQVVVVPAASPLSFNDIPVTVDLSPGTVIGIHGGRAESVAAAMILRLALEVGPADWRLLTVSGIPDVWTHLSSLAHFRRSPLDHDDLQGAETSTLHEVIWVTDPADIAHRRAPARRYAQSRRVSLIVSVRSQRELPADCTRIIDATDPEVDGVGPTAARDIVEALSRWQDPDAGSLTLPSTVRLADMTPGRLPTKDDVIRRWSTARTSLMIDLGSGVDGPMSIDLVADGPHAVVVGTTGSGKSELLRTVVTTLALNNSPSVVNLVLVDYKGGSAFDACADLPHVAAVVTDLDGDGYEKTADRMLRGLESELRRREVALRSVGVSNQAEYQLSKPNSAPPMPKLVIVIDELAALRADVPDLASALVAVAQRGRSLGLHLILATQRPGVELSSDVVSNSSLRIALRLASREDSSHVLGHPMAAGIPRTQPGRAAISIGGQAPEEFQVLQVSEDLAALLSTVRSAADDLRIPPPRRPWCAALPTRLTPTPETPTLAVGVVDDPDAQRQFPLLWTPRTHLSINGGPGSGKSSALFAVLAALIRHDSSATYFVISGNGDRPTDSSCVAVQDSERMFRVLSHVSNEIEGRQRTGVDGSPLVLFVDDVDVWRSLHIDDRRSARHWEMFERIVACGPSVGVTCAVSSTREHGLPGFIGSRLAQVWSAAERPGSFNVAVPGSSTRLTAQIFDPTAFCGNLRELTAGVDRNVLAVLPTSVLPDGGFPSGTFGLRAEDLSAAVLPAAQGLRALIIGHRRSGRSTALHALRHAWIQVNPNGCVVNVADPDSHSKVLAGADGVPTLLIVDDVDRSEAPRAVIDVVMHSLEAPHGGSLSIVAVSSPHFLRTRTDHWLNRLRVSRTGALLGRCSEEDGDLLGHFARTNDVVPRSSGRGLWIQDGEGIGTVQFFDRPIGPMSGDRNCPSVTSG